MKANVKRSKHKRFFGKSVSQHPQSPETSVYSRFNEADCELAMPMVSVIVPFYNVEDSVRYCVESLLAQTYINYELVLIDDGSTDSTSTILSDFECLDNRIRLIRKQNGGLSDARNHGIRVANGDYVTFVDGDDIVSPVYLEHLVAAAVECPDALVVGSFRNVRYQDALKGDVDWCEIADYSVVSREQCVSDFMYNRVTESAWGKLVHRSAYDSDFFPCGRLYEDLATFPLLLSAYDKFVYTNCRDYGYVDRSGSIVRPRSTSLSQVDDFIDAYSRTQLLQTTPSSRLYRESLSIMRMQPILERVGDDSLRAKQIIDENKSFIRSNMRVLLCDRGAPLLQRARFLLFSIEPRLAELALGVTRRISF